MLCTVDQVFIGVVWVCLRARLGSALCGFAWLGLRIRYQVHLQFQRLANHHHGASVLKTFAQDDHGGALVHSLSLSLSLAPSLSLFLASLTIPLPPSLSLSLSLSVTLALSLSPSLLSTLAFESPYLASFDLVLILMPEGLTCTRFFGPYTARPSRPQLKFGCSGPKPFWPRWQRFMACKAGSLFAERGLNCYQNLFLRIP